LYIIYNRQVKNLNFYEKNAHPDRESNPGSSAVYENKQVIDVYRAISELHNMCKEQWKVDAHSVPKLRTYCLYKYNYEKESYVYKVHNRGHRSVLTQLRCGILPLSIETGRFTSIPIEFRLCILCDANVVEDEKHFLFDCSFYNEIRDIYNMKFRGKYPNLDLMDDNSKLKCCMHSDLVKITAEFIYTCYTKRREFIYR
jgi:hypothetical protein